MLKLVLMLLLPLSIHAQGPLDGYMKGKGVLDLAPSFSFNAAQKFEGINDQTYDETYKGQLLSLFAEYGLNKYIDIVGTAAAVFTPNKSGLQDGGLFLKYRPFHKKLDKAGTLSVLFGSGLTFPMTDYSPTATGALGQKAITLPLKCIAQWETPLGIFINFTGGYHLRLDNVSGQDVAIIQKDRPDYQAIAPQNFSTYLVKIGFPARHFYLDAWAEWQHTGTGNNFSPNVPDLAQTFAVSYTQVGGTAYYTDGGRSGFFLSGGYILNGKNVSRIRRITFGMVIKIGSGKA